MRKVSTIATVIAGLISPLITQNDAQASGIPVFDGAANGNWILDLAKMQEQLMELQNILGQAKEIYDQTVDIYDSFSKTTGMSGLVTSPGAKYLPKEYREAIDLLAKGKASMDDLEGDAADIRDANRVIDPLKDLPPELRNSESLKLLDQQGMQAAQFAAASQQALRASEDRIAKLNSYVSALQGSKDPKDTMDLQAAISAEGLFLQNETIKMMAMLQAAQAQQMLNETKDKETQQQSIDKLLADFQY